METVLIAGGTGLVGMHLSKMLIDKGYEVLHLSRRENLAATYPAYQWDLKAGTIDERALQKADYIINLAGAGIADARWTKARKKLIIDSRVDSANLIRKCIEEGQTNPKAYLSASAIGYYGNRGEEWMDEHSAPAPGEFLSDSVAEWEASIDAVAKTGIRTAAIRIGIVLSTKGGALEKMLISFNFMQGAYFGDGSMWTSWIHIDDVCRIFIHALEDDSFECIYNGVSPEPARNKEIIKAIKKAKNSLAVLLPVPAFALKTIFGEMSAAILGSTRVSAEKLKTAGFVFEYPSLLPAIKDLLKRKI